MITNKTQRGMNYLAKSIEAARLNAAETQSELEIEVFEQTLVTIETKYSCWYIDYQPESSRFLIFRDEKFIVSRDSIGEALEYVFGKLPSRDLVLRKK